MNLNIYETDVEQDDYKVNRKHKATLFAKLFGEDKENALSLYNAVNNSNYTNADDLTFTTLDDVVYMKMKNDVSFMIDRAVDECAGEGALGRFLDKHRREVRNMVLTEFDEEKYLEMMREEEWADGHNAGLKEGRLENLTDILKDLGEIPAEILERMKDLDGEGIKEWTKLASRAESMKEFLQKIKC